MKIKNHLYIVILAIAFTVNGKQVTAQQPPFYNEIQAFKKLDSAAQPTSNAILFIGSSSFRKWTGIQDSFPNNNILNRAFGGATFIDLIYYAKDVLAPYQAKQVLIYCGDNDLASSDTITPEIVLRRFTTLYYLIKKYQPKAQITFVSIKPSPSRANLMAKMEKTNWLIKTFLSKRRHSNYIDVYHPMLLQNGKPDPSLFVADNLHMNAKGYDIWTRSITPFLVK